MSWNLIFVIVSQLIAILAIIHVVLDNRQPAKTLAWALVIWFVPVAGVVFYLFFGINTRKERYVSERSMNQLPAFQKQPGGHLYRWLPVLSCLVAGDQQGP